MKEAAGFERLKDIIKESVITSGRSMESFIVEDLKLSRNGYYSMFNNSSLKLKMLLEICDKLNMDITILIEGYAIIGEDTRSVDTEIKKKDEDKDAMDKLLRRHIDLLEEEIIKLKGKQ